MDPRNRSIAFLVVALVVVGCLWLRFSAVSFPNWVMVCMMLVLLIFISIWFIRVVISPRCEDYEDKVFQLCLVTSFGEQVIRLVLSRSSFLALSFLGMRSLYICHVSSLQCDCFSGVQGLGCEISYKFSTMGSLNTVCMSTIVVIVVRRIICIASICPTNILGR